MGPKSHDVLIVKRGQAISAKMHEGLLQSGYSTQLVNDLKECAKALQSVADPVLLVDCGVEEDPAYACIKELIEMTELHLYPVVVIGKDVDGYEGVLNRYFKAIATITLPCTLAEVVKGVEYTLKASAGLRPAPIRRSSEPPSPPPSGAYQDSSLDSKPLADNLYKNFQDIPEALFAQFTKLNLFERPVEGERYTSGVAEQDLKERGLVPHDPKVQEAFSTILSSTSKWGRGHICRIAFLTSRILELLGISSELKECSKISVLLFPLSFPAGDKELLKQDYLGNRFVILRKDLCSRLKDSAMKIAVELAKPEAGNIVASMARLVGREEQVHDTPEGLVSNTIMTADLVDRVCFHSGCWNPHAAYSLLRKFKSGKIKDTHPAVLACVIKLLSEAISASPALILSKKDRLNPALVAEAARIENQSVGAHEVKVPISKLAPGMRLTRPLVAYDGTEILSSDLLLDQDLIWRIWQLSAIRPLNGPAVVLTPENSLLS